MSLSKICYLAAVVVIMVGALGMLSGPTLAVGVALVALGLAIERE